MTRDELEAVFWRATILCLGLDPDDTSESVQKRVRRSWTKMDIGAAGWSREENVVFLHILPTQEEFARAPNRVSYVYNADRNMYQEIVDQYDSWKISWICYGPDAHEDATAIRVGILRTGITDYLQANNIGIQPHIQQPQYFPEQEDSGDWFERYDLTAYFYERVLHSFETEVIEQAPDITIIEQ